MDKTIIPNIIKYEGTEFPLYSDSELSNNLINKKATLKGFKLGSMSKKENDTLSTPAIIFDIVIENGNIVSLYAPILLMHENTN